MDLSKDEIEILLSAIGTHRDEYDYKFEAEYKEALIVLEEKLEHELRPHIYVGTIAGKFIPDGTKERPFGSIEDALNKAAETPESIVVLKQGVYRLSADDITLLNKTKVPIRGETNE